MEKTVNVDVFEKATNVRENLHVSASMEAEKWFKMLPFLDAFLLVSLETRSKLFSIGATKIIFSPFLRSVVREGISYFHCLYYFSVFVLTAFCSLCC